MCLTDLQDTSSGVSQQCAHAYLPVSQLQLFDILGIFGHEIFVVLLKPLQCRNELLFSGQKGHSKMPRACDLLKSTPWHSADACTGTHGQTTFVRLCQGNRQMPHSLYVPGHTLWHSAGDSTPACAWSSKFDKFAQGALTCGFQQRETIESVSLRSRCFCRGNGLGRQYQAWVSIHRSFQWLA